jgi:ABC-type antimicrobial peptide transport system permease subunit
MQYNNPLDSATVYHTSIDENYIPLHAHKLIAGKNFTSKPATQETEIIVNEQLLKRFDIGDKDPAQAIGETVNVGKNSMTIIGVIEDFHHISAISKIEPFIFRYSPDETNYLQLKINAQNISSTLILIDKAWRKVDNIHPLDATFFSDQIEKSYTPFFAIVKISGFLAFLSISIASIGLLGMVVYSAATRLKEVCMRKVLGASDADLIYLLSKEFLILLFIALLVTTPSAYILFSKFILSSIAYPAPVLTIEWIGALLIIALLILLMIGSLTMKTAQSNPAQVLKNE